MNFTLNCGNRRRRRCVGNRNAHNITAHLFQTLDLIHRGGDILGFGVGHGLDADQCPSTDEDIAHPDLAGLFAVNGKWHKT